MLRQGYKYMTVGTAAFIPLNGVRQSDIGHKGDGLCPISVLRDTRRRGTVQVSHHVGRFGGILRPLKVTSTVGIQIVDEVNQLVAHVSGSVSSGGIYV